MTTIAYPLICVPLSKFFSTPPSNINSTAFLIISCPQIEGASDFDKISKTFRFCDNSLILRISMSVIIGEAMPPPAFVLNKLMLLQIITVLY